MCIKNWYLAMQWKGIRVLFGTEGGRLTFVDVFGAAEQESNLCQRDD
jgi:hypothetical protein